MGNCRKTTLRHYDGSKNLTGVYSQSVDTHLHGIHCFIAMIIVTLFFTYSFFDNVHVRATNTLKVHLVKLLKFYSSLHSTNFYWTFSMWEEWGEGEGDDRGWDGWMVSRERVTRELVMDMEAWRAAVHGVAKSWTQLSDWTELNWTYLYGLVVFPTFLNLRMNLAIWSSWSEPQSAPGLVFADCIELLL